jgi:hypothetical protein
VEADLLRDGAIRLKLGPSVIAGLVHFVVAVPCELDGACTAGSVDGAGDAVEGELAATLAIEEDVAAG